MVESWPKTQGGKHATLRLVRQPTPAKNPTLSKIWVHPLSGIDSPYPFDSEW